MFKELPTLRTLSTEDKALTMWSLMLSQPQLLELIAIYMVVSINKLFSNLDHVSSPDL